MVVLPSFGGSTLSTKNIPLQQSMSATPIGVVSPISAPLKMPTQLPKTGAISNEQSSVFKGLSKSEEQKAVDYVKSKFTRDQQKAKLIEITDQMIARKKQKMTLGEKNALRQKNIMDSVTINKDTENPLLRAGKGLLGAFRGGVEGLHEGLVEGGKQYAEDVKNAPTDEKLPMGIYGGAGYLGNILGKTFGGGMSGLAKGFMTEEERNIAGEKVKGAVKEGSAIDKLSKWYGALPEEQKAEVQPYLRGLEGVSNFLGAGLLEKPIQEGLEYGAKQTMKGLEKVTTPILNKAELPNTNKIAEGLIASNLKNPAMREKYISKVGQTPEKTLLEDGIKGTLEQQTQQVLDKAKASREFARSEVSKIPDTIKSKEGAWITKKIIEDADTSIPGIQAKIGPIQEMAQRFQQGTATANDLIDAKTFLSRYETIYDDFGRPKKTGDVFEKEALADMYTKMKTDLEDMGSKYGIDMQRINHDTMKYEGLRGLMSRALAREAGRDVFSLSDYVLGGYGAVIDPVSTFIVLGGKKLLQSPAISSKLANALYKKEGPLDLSVRNKKNDTSVLSAPDSNPTPKAIQETVKQQKPIPKKLKKNDLITSDDTTLGLPASSKSSEGVSVPKSLPGFIGEKPTGLPLKQKKIVESLPEETAKKSVANIDELASDEQGKTIKELKIIRDKYIAEGKRAKKIYNLTSHPDDFNRVLVANGNATRLDTYLSKLETTTTPVSLKETPKLPLKMAGNSEQVSKKVGLEKKDGSKPTLPLKAKSTETSDLTSSIKKAKAEGKTFDEFVSSQEKEGKILYHGTKYDFQKFDNKYLGTTTQAGSSKQAHFFTNKEHIAKGYANLGDAPKVEKLSRQVDLLEKEARKTGNWDAYDKANEKLEELAYSDANKYEGKVLKTSIDMGKTKTIDMKGEAYTEGKLNDIITKAKNEGYDSVVLKNSADAVNTPIGGGKRGQEELSDVIAVFDAKRIKTTSQLRTERDKLDQPATPKGMETLYEEARKYKSAEDFVEYLRTSIDDYSEGDFMTAKPLGLEKRRMERIDYVSKNYTTEKQGWFAGAKKFREEANKKVPLKPKT